LIVFGRAWLDFAGFGSIWFWLGLPLHTDEGFRLTYVRQALEGTED
jgi:hypothetical protein